MTDKEQIIINGVDVSGCDFLAKEDIYNSYSGVTTAYKGQCGCSDDEMCKDHRNCGYKKLARQLQRKTAELDEYKKSKQSSYEALQARANELEMSNRKLKQECEELKAYAQAQENQRETYYKEFLRKDKALDEIEEISDDYNRVEKTSQYYRDGFEEILDIISKVKEGNDE